MHSIDKKINELGLFLPKVSTPIANYLPYKIHKEILYISGQGPIKDGKILYSGKIGKDLSTEEGILASKLCCLNILSIIRDACKGDWEKFESILKIGGFVNCIDEFKDQPKIINGASDMLVEIFGEKGKHSRFAVGSNSLPMNISVEIDAIIKLC